MENIRYKVYSNHAIKISNKENGRREVRCWIVCLPENVEFIHIVLNNPNTKEVAIVIKTNAGIQQNSNINNTNIENLRL